MHLGGHELDTPYHPARGLTALWADALTRFVAGHCFAEGRVYALCFDLRLRGRVRLGRLIPHLDITVPLGVARRLVGRPESGLAAVVPTIRHALDRFDGIADDHRDGDYVRAGWALGKTIVRPFV